MGGIFILRISNNEQGITNVEVLRYSFLIQYFLFNQGITNVEVLRYSFLIQYFLFNIRYSKISTRNESLQTTRLQAYKTTRPQDHKTMSHKGVISNRYRIIKDLGSGGMGVVYQVEDLLSKKILALKAIADKSIPKEAILQFKREFTSLSTLRHPNLVEVYDLGTTDEGLPFYTMEYIDGINFPVIKDKLKEDNYNLFYDILVQICRALEYIHSKGIIHYDINSNNIMLIPKDSNYIVKLLDFGLAEESKSIVGLKVRGTPGYIAPEVIRGVDSDKRADLYSLGVVLYEIVTGEIPFKGDSTISILKKHLEQNPIPPKKINPKIPNQINNIILRLLEKEPQNRYSSANQVIEEINHSCNKNFELETSETGKSYILSGRFIGREKEIEKFKRLLNRAESGKDSFLSIDGEAGMGKHRLLQEFRVISQLQNVPVFIGRCYERKEKMYQPFIEILQQMIYLLPSDSYLLKRYGPELVKLLPQIISEKDNEIKPSFKLEPEQEKLRLMEAITRFINEWRISDHRFTPIVIMFDDMQWADSLTVELLDYIIRNTMGEETNKTFHDDISFIESESSRNTLLICTTHRDSEVDENHLFRKTILKNKNKHFFYEISLKNLSYDDVISLVSSMLGMTPSASDFLNRIYQETLGNPLYVEEIMKTLVEENIIFREEGVWKTDVDDFSKIEISSNIKDIITRRLLQLNEDSKTILKIASVIGKEFDFQLILQTSEYDENNLFEILNNLVNNKILIEYHTENGFRWDFAHKKMCEVLNNSIPAEEKCYLHQKVGNALERMPEYNKDIERIAYHFLNGKDREKAVIYGIQAGERSAGLYDNQTAIWFYQKVIDILKDGKDDSIKNAEITVNLLKKLGDIYNLIGLYDKAIESFNDAIKIISEVTPLDSSIERASIYREIGNIYEKSINYPKSLEYFKKSIEALTNQNLDLSEKFAFSELSEKIAFEKFSESYKDSQERLVELGKIYSRIGLLYSRMMDNEKAIEFAKESLKILETTLDYKEISYTYNVLGIISSNLGDNESAVLYYQKGLELGQKIGDLSRIAVGYNNLALIYVENGEIDKGIEYYLKTIEIADKIGDITKLAGANANLGRAYIKKYDWEKAKEYTAKTLALYKKIGNPKHIVIGYENLGTVYYSSGNDWDKAISLYNEGLEIAKRENYLQFISMLCGSLSNIYAQRGLFDKAIECTEIDIDVCNKMEDSRGLTSPYLNLSFIYMIFGEYDTALEYANKSLELAKSTKNDLLINSCYYNLAQICRYMKELDKAEEYINESFKIVNSFKQEESYYWTLLEQAEIYFEKELYKKCEEKLSEVLSVVEKFDMKILLVSTLILQSKLELEIEPLLSIPQVEKYISKAMAVAERTGMVEEQTQLHYLQSKIWIRRGQLEKAEDELLSAIRIMGTASSSIKDERIKNRYLNTEKRRVIYEDWNEITQVKSAGSKLLAKLYFKEIEKISKQYHNLEILHNVIRKIASPLHLDELLDTLMDLVIEVTRTERGFLMLINEETKSFEVKVARDKNKQPLSESDFEISTTISQQVVESGRSVFITDAQSDEKFRKQGSVLALDLHTVVCLPLKVKEKVIGIIYVDNRSLIENFDENDLVMFESLANHAALAIEKARLYDELSQANQELNKKIEQLSFLHKAGRYISSTLKIDELSKIVYTQVQKIIPSDAFIISLYNIKRDEITIEYQLDRGKEYGREKGPLGKGLNWWVISNRKPLLANSKEDLKKLNIEMILSGSKEIPESFLSVPMMAEDKPIGVISLQSYAPNSFTEDDVRVLTILANQAAIAFENARLYAEVQSQERMRQEILVAAQIQEELLPKGIKDVPGLDIATFVLPARNIGGDYLDVIPQGETKTIFCIGDVSGKGVPAGMIMLMARTIVHSLVPVYQSTKPILSQINKILKPDIGEQRFMTMLIMCWDSESKKLTYTSAGHEHLIIYKSKEKKCDVKVSGGILIGLTPDIDEWIHEREIPLDQGDVLVLYTDGITEARSKDKKMFGLKRLVKSVETHGDKNHIEIKDGILSDIKNFVGDEEQHDDITLLVIKRK